MSQIRFNQAFVGLLVAGTAGAFFIPPRITDRAKGKEEILLYPIVKPVRAIAALLSDKYAEKRLPPGETHVRADSQVAGENVELRQHVVFLHRQLEDLRLVEAERKRLGPLLDYFAPVAVIAGDATPGRESLSVMPTAGVDFSPKTPVMCSDGLVGTIVEGRRVRLITDVGFTITGQFGRWDNGQWVAVTTPQPSVRGIGGGALRVDNLFLKDVEQVRPGDWVIVNDTELHPLLQGRQIGQVESKRPIPAKPLFAEIIVKPRTDLRKLNEVLVLRK